MLLKHKTICYDLEALRFVDVNENMDTLTLKEFTDV